MDIETAATTVIKSRIANTDRLSQFINERDKEPIWDGAIYAYKSKSRSNDNIIGRAPVQVKGKEVKTIKKDKITYCISITNLKSLEMMEGYYILWFIFLRISRKKYIMQCCCLFC